MSNLFKIANIRMQDSSGKIKYDACLFDVQKDKLCKSFPCRIIDIFFFDLDEEAFNSELEKQRCSIYIRDCYINGDAYINIIDREYYS